MFFYRNPLKWVQNLEISASSAWEPQGDQFGTTVSLNSSGETMVATSAGTWNEQDLGYAIVFKKDEQGKFQQVQTLRPIGLSVSDSDNFGNAPVLMSKDASTIAIHGYNDGEGLFSVYLSGSDGYYRNQVISSSSPSTEGGQSSFGRASYAISDDSQLLALGARGDDTGGADRGKISFYNKNETGKYELQQDFILPEQMDMGSLPGSLSTDKTKLFVGDKYYVTGSETDGNDKKNAGAVHLLQSGSNGFELVQTITPDDSTPGTGFGIWVSYSSQTDTLVALREEEPYAPNIYVFTSGSNGYEQTQKIEHIVDYNFNWIKISDDGTKLFVVAYKKVDNPKNKSSILLYESGSNGFEFSVEIQSDETYSNWELMSGKSFEYDQINNITVAGATGYDVAGVGAQVGAIYVFDSGSSGWQQSQLITASDDWSPVNDVFGETISLANNNEILGIHQKDSSNILFQNGKSYPIPYNTDGVGGSVYIYKKDGEGYKQVQRILSPKMGTYPGFGRNFSFSRSGDKIAIPYPFVSNNIFTGSVDDPIDSNDPNNGLWQGAIYIYQSGSGGYSLVQEIKKDPPNNFFTFGNGGAVFDNTTGNKLFASGLDYSTGGSIYVYESGSSGYVQTQELTSGEPVVDGSDYFINIKLSSDDQILLVGAPYDDTEAAANIGSLTIFVSGSTGYQKAQKLTPDDTTDPDGYMSFGYSEKTLAISEDNQTIVVGARGEKVQPDNSVDRSGAVRIYQSGSSGYEQVQFIPAPEEDGVNGNLFGSSVDISGSFLAIGSIYDRQNATDPVSWTSKNKGSVWIYEKINGTYEKKYRIRTEGNRNYETGQGTWSDGWAGFGSSVKLLPNNELLVSSPYDDKNGTDSGVVYKYKLTRDY